MNISIVIGLGFGDESKGATVNSLIEYPNETIVFRFNAGHQVGHTVVHNNIRHVFSNFGSGTLKGVPTYWSEYCTVNPLAVKKEGDILRAQGITPIVYYDANAMVTTPYDIYQNLNNNMNLNHGTVGVGFGTTIQRNEDHYHLYVRDLMFPKIRDKKLNLISDYVYEKMSIGINFKNANNIKNEIIEKVIDEFKLACDDLVNRFRIINNFNRILGFNKDLIFEGGQGIMLDMNYGFFPNVTRSNTTSKNAFEIIDRYDLRNNPRTTYYVTRAYQTRHGHGFMSNKGLDISYIQENLLETNTNDGHQGIFRKSVLDLDLLKYAIDCDNYHNSTLNKKIVISCLDQVPEDIPVTINDKLTTKKFDQIGSCLGMYHTYGCYSDKGFIK